MTQTAIQPTEMKPLFVVDTPPYMHRGGTIRHMMLDTLIALAPAAIMAIYWYGLPAFRVMALAAGTAVLAEYAWDRMIGRRIRVDDCTSLVTGVLLAFLLPAGAPWWLVVTGAMVAVILGRQVFGGLGCNPLCPPLVAWAILTVSWPMFMDPAAMNLHSDMVDPLLRLKYFGADSVTVGTVPLLLGEQLGGLGSSQIAAVAAGGIFLLARRGIRWEVPVFFLLGVLGASTLFWLYGADMGINFDKYPVPAEPAMYFLTGSTVFTAFFLATDHSSSPVATGGLMAYGLLAGILLVLIRVFGIYPDGAPFAVLLTSLGTPLFDLIRRAPFGKRSSHHA